VTLLDSLLDAIVRLEGDALVMHVGEKPYVVTTSSAMNAYRGPLAWGQVELSSRVLTSEAVLGMLGQILPLEKRQELEELGAVDHEVPAADGVSERFIVVAARGGDDVWLELRRKPKEPIVEAVPDEPPVVMPAESRSAASEKVPSPTVESLAPAADDVQPIHPSAIAIEETVVDVAASGSEDEKPFEVIEEEEQVVEPVAMEEVAVDLGEPVSKDETPFEIVQEGRQTAPTDADVNALLEASAAALLSSAPPVEPAPALPTHEQVPTVLEQIPIVQEVSLDVDSLAPSVSAPVESIEPVVEEVEVIHTTASVNPAPVAVQPPTLAVEPAATAAKADTEAVSAPAAWSQPVAVEPERVDSEAAPSPVAVEAPALEPREPRAVVLPLSRTPVRSEAVTPATSGRVEGFSVEELLRVAAARGASTVYVVAQSQPMVRADGEINAIDIGSGAPLTESDVNRLVLDLAPPAARDAWQRGAVAEWMCDVADVGRVRCLTFREHRGPGLIFRMIPPRAISADQLGLTPEVQALCSQSEGLVLVTGPRASGKSTLLCAFVDLINRTRSDHVVTVESQIGFLHESRRSFVSQREVRGDSEAVVSAVRSALREDPDVLLIEDLRSAEIAAAALEAADSGRLVFGSLPAASTVAAIDRLLELFPSERRTKVQASLAGTLRGMVAQVLLRRSRGGRVAAREVLLNTPSVAALIEEAKILQLPLAIESGRRYGMIPLNDALVAFVRDGTVHVTEAYLKAFDKEGILAALKRDGVDTSFAERLA
jgi:twitching motility protein PilT